MSCDELHEAIGSPHHAPSFESHVRQLEADELLLNVRDVAERPIEIDGVGRDVAEQPAAVGVDLIALRLEQRDRARDRRRVISERAQLRQCQIRRQESD